MQALMLLERVVRWRWAPCVGLIAGSLSFVLVAIAVIPRQFGRVGDDGPLLTRAGDVETDGVAATPSDPGASSRSFGGRTLSQATSPPVQPLSGNNGVVSGIFAPPPMQLPVAPPDPNPYPLPQPEAPPPPPPAPQPTIFELPAPPTPPPNPPAVDHANAAVETPPEPAVTDTAAAQSP